MTDETKELFNAPWKADVCCEVYDKNESLVCICCPGEPHIANRLARLPELYDALLDAANRLCGEPKIRGEYACKSCVVKDSCQVRKWYELLEKVGEGT